MGTKAAAAATRGDVDLSKESLDKLRARVDARLQAHFADAGQDGALVCAIRHSLLSPGKRLRPIITLLACRQSGGDVDDAVDAAAAVEMVHAASLIMDDLPSMDDARLRRGRLTTHVVFGENAAMLASVGLLNEAYRVLATSKAIPCGPRLRALDRLTRSIGIDGLIGGQQRDIGSPAAPADARSLSDVQRGHVEKTGALFGAAAAIGGEAAHADAETVDLLWAYGCELGLAYQALDDVVDTTTSSEAAGKDIDQDAGKSTVVSFLGAEGAQRAAERWLDRAASSAKAAATRAAGPGGPVLLADLAGMIGAKFCTAAGHARP
ncbi:MAG: polyprenyl synthetase family protein [Pseudomonadota bacterium]